MRILVIGIDFFSYSNALAEAFKQLGHVVCVEEIKQNWGGIIGKLHSKYAECKRHKGNLTYKVPNLVSSWRTKKILATYNIFKPDLVVAFPGYFVTKEMLDAMRGCVKVIWVYDAIERHHELLELLGYFNKIYTFEGSDIPKYKKLGYNASFLPLCADPKIYYPLDCEKEIDISFVGNLSVERLKMLMNIHKTFPQLKMKIYGKYDRSLEWFGEIGKQLSENADIFAQKLISGEEANLLYAKSKICLNMHHSQTKFGGNMRLYETMAAGGFQVVDGNEYIKDNFSDCVAIFNNYNELIDKISWYIKHERERERISKNGYNKVHSSELFIHRAMQIIEDIELT